MLHVHSTFSDGTANVVEIADAARAAGAQAVLLTDHDTLAARRAGCEGWHDGVLVLVGLEISPADGHLLAFGVDEEIAHDGRSEAELVDAVRRSGGLSFPAHPFSAGSRMSRRVGRPHPWTTIAETDATGLELWNVGTEGAERCATPAQLWRFLRRPEAAVVAPPAENVATWDRLCRRRPCVAIGGLDAHQTGVRLGRRVAAFTPNRRAFATLRTHVLLDQALTGDATADAAAVYAALGAGRCYLAVETEASAHGFTFGATGTGRTVAMGSEAPAGDWTLQAELPHPADLRTHLRWVRDRQDDGSPPGTTRGRCGRLSPGGLARRDDLGPFQSDLLARLAMRRVFGQRELATVVSSAAVPAGYTVSIWSSGAILIDARGTPAVWHAILFAVGALAALTLLGGTARHLGRGAQPASGDRERATVGALDWIAAGAATGSAALVAQIPTWVAWPLASFVATTLYLLLATAQLRAVRALYRD